MGILNSGDLFIWNKDNDILRYVEGMKDFAYRLGFHYPSVYISNDTNKILVLTSRNKIFIFENDEISNINLNESQSFISNKNSIRGNWSAITAPKDIKTVEDNKELVISARFNSSIVSRGGWIFILNKIFDIFF